jgi:glucokinase
VTARVAVAIDVGGTGVKGMVVGEDGRVLATSSAPTPAGDGPAAVVTAVRAFARELAGRAAGVPLAAAGLVVPGSVDAQAGIARYSANIGWRDVPFADLLTADLGVPVVLEHDVRAAGIAEVALGSAGGAADCAIVVIGTGIAGVLVCGGEVVRGATGLAGELGHMPVRPGGEQCACGQRGCLETYASAAAIARRYARDGGAARPTSEIVGRLDRDPLARRVWDEAVAALADAVIITTMATDPAVVVVGGGLSQAGEALFAPLRAAVTARLTWRPAPRLELSPLGAWAGRYGAAVLAWRTVGVTDFAGWPLD